MRHMYPAIHRNFNGDRKAWFDFTYLEPGRMVVLRWYGCSVTQQAIITHGIGIACMNLDVTTIEASACMCSSSSFFRPAYAIVASIGRPYHLARDPHSSPLMDWYFGSLYR